MKSFFNTLSYIFHPILLPVLGLYFLFETPTNSPGYIVTSLYNLPLEFKINLYKLFGFLTILAPGISIWIMYQNKIISSIKLENRLERFTPIGITAVYYVMNYVLLRIMIPEHMIISFIFPYAFGLVLIVIAAFIMNYFTKISLHMLGFFGVIGTIMGYFQNQLDYNLFFLIFLIIVGGLIGSARIYLKAHTLKEVVLGIIIGFGIGFVCMKFELYI
jgi:membrane-associated phospholipid phosphatase